MSRPYRVAVVGFGVAGGTIAHLLGQAGHAVDLYERAPRVTAVGAGVLVQPSGQLVLRRLGLLDEVVAHAEPVEELDVHFDRGGTLIRLPFAAIAPGCRAYGVHRGNLFTVLHKAVVASSVRIHLDREVHSFRRAKAADVLLTDIHGGEHGPFDFVVAAEGSRSMLRGCGRLTTRVLEYGHGACWTIGRSNAVRGKLLQVVRGTTHLLGLLPMGDGRCSLFYGLPCARHDETWKRGFAAWRDEVLGLCPLAEELLNGVRGFEDVSFTTYRHVWMKRWHCAEAVFIGDAAHAMSPHLGQGVNLALLDAWHLAEAVAATRSPREAFVRYTERRRAHFALYATVTFLMAPFFQSDGVVARPGPGRGAAADDAAALAAAANGPDNGGDQGQLSEWGRPGVRQGVGGGSQLHPEWFNWG